MIAAIYARKSTEQAGADVDAKSVARQIENARTFAIAKGWRVEDAHVYSDDAISGAEIRKLVNRQRLLDALEHGRPPFQVLIMRDASRFSRRDGDEAFGELKRIAQAGVTIWFYQDGAPFAFGTFGDNVVGFVRAEMNAEYRRQIARWTHEAMIRKAKAGHVAGGSVFGYDNVRVEGHVERRINEAEATVIRRIFAGCADGTGYTRLAKQLNEEHALTPRPRKGRPAGWCPSSVREVLHRPLYRGEVVYNRTRRRDVDGTTTFAPRPESDWIRVPRPELRIVSADAWQAAHARLGGIRAYVKGIGFTRRRDIESQYLLSGFARCAVCGASVAVLDRGKYGCTAYHKRGTTICGNALKQPIATVDEAVLARLRADVLRPKAVMAIVDGLLRQFAPATRAHDLSRRRGELETIDRQIANLAAAIADGGLLPPLLAELQRRQTRRDDLARLIAGDEAVDVTRFDRPTMERTVRTCLEDWRARLTGRAVDQTRQALREILVGPLTLTPAGRTYRFEGELLTGRLLAGSVGLTNLGGAPGGALDRLLRLKFSGVAA